ncbi:MAG: NUDIX domain-containing protein [Bacteroidales bacterium]|nr:NUDIX domain-containing protein [Bacteroidales bacterium]
MQKEKRPFLAVRAIITNEEGNVLILKRANTIQSEGKWCLPGGNIEYGQTAEEAIKKEVKQETSFSCTEIRFLSYLENPPSEESDLHYVNLIFECRTKGRLKLNYESSDYAWIGPDDLQNYKFAFRNEVIIERYLESEKYFYF